MNARIALLSLSVLCVACVSQEQRIKNDIARANTCDTENDCVLVGSKCPFDCYIYANAQEADRIRTLVDGFDSRCVYSCVASEGVACRNHRCEAVTEVPSLPPPPPDETSGNVGAACGSHAECKTPMGYLVRSNCPFASMCVDGSCAVVCPMSAHDPNPALSRGSKASCTRDADCDCGGYAASDPNTCRCIDAQCVAVMATAD